MTVGDAGEHALWQRIWVLDEVRREHTDAAGEGLRLFSAALVGAVEDTVEQLGVGREHALVEDGGDVRDALSHEGQRRFDHGAGLL